VNNAINLKENIEVIVAEDDSQHKQRFNGCLGTLQNLAPAKDQTNGDVKYYSPRQTAVPCINMPMLSYRA
jgi:hypothetical protein